MKSLKDITMNDLCELAGVPYDADIQVEEIAEENESASAIKALRDTDYRDKDAFFKLTQLLKGLAVASEKDKLAYKFMSAVSDAMTDAAKMVLGKGE